VGTLSTAIGEPEIERFAEGMRAVLSRQEVPAVHGTSAQR
jgi:hypothetical protein